MPKFRKKPVVIEAEQYRLDLEDGFATIGEAIIAGYSQSTYRRPRCAEFYGIPYIDTLEGRHFIGEGDWIITGVAGERYPCKDSIFRETYEAVESG